MSRRKQEKPQPRKNLIKGESELVQDILTCGICQKDFPLADIVLFIQHKVHSCNKENCLGRFFEDSEDSQEPVLRVPIKEEIKEDLVSSSSLNHKTSTTKDISVNTNSVSEPRNYVCSTCKQSLTSAWELILHVQHQHGLNIYVESNSSQENNEARQESTTDDPSPNGNFGLRAPLLERQIEPAPLFPRTSSSHQELRLDLLGLSSSSCSNGPVAPSTTPPPLLEASQIPHCEPVQDFYSQRLRVLAGATSPNASKLLQPSFKAVLNNNNSSNNSKESSPEKPQHNSSASSTASDAQTPSKGRLCEYCGKSFQFKSNLIVHRRSHTGEKPFKCHICNHACTQASKLKRHMKTHRKKKEAQKDADASSSPKNNGSEKDAGEKQTNGGGDFGSEDEEEEEIDVEDEEDEEVNVDGLEDDEVRENGEGKLVIDHPVSDDGMVAEDLTKKPLKNGKASDDSSDREEKKTVKHSLLSEVMEKIGLTSIQQYNEAYKQALKESSARNSVKQERCSSGTEGSASNDGGSFFGGGYDGAHPERPPREGTRSAGQSPLGFGSGLLGAFDQSLGLKRLRLDEPWKHEKERDGGGSLYAGLWVPAVSHSYRDLFGLDGHPKSSSTESALNSGGGEAGRNSSPRPGTSPLCTGALKPKEPQRRNDTCEYCGKVFKNCSNLTVHRRSHTGEKPYKCELCSYACAQSSKLTRHMKTHGRLGKDVYRCRFCDMPFSVPSTLEKHMRKCVVSQSGGSPYLMSERDSDSKEMAT